MNKKGFTLVEVLAVIAIIGLIGLIGVISYNYITENSKLRVFKMYEKTMYSDTVTLLVTEPNLIPVNGETKRFYLSDIKISPINNPRNKDDLCPNSYVEVTRNDYSSSESNTYVDAFLYKVCLKCEQSDYNVNGNSCEYFPNSNT